MRPTDSLRGRRSSPRHSGGRIRGGALYQFAGVCRTCLLARTPRFSLSTDTIQNLSDVFLECDCLGPWVTEVEQVHLVRPAKLIEGNLIRMFSEKLSEAFLGDPSALRFQPAPFFPPANLALGHVEKFR